MWRITSIVGRWSSDRTAMPIRHSRPSSGTNAITGMVTILGIALAEASTRQCKCVRRDL